MTKEQLSLAQRLAACKQWKWRGGMAFEEPTNSGDATCGRIGGASTNGERVWVQFDDSPQSPNPEWVPDLSDYAMASILLRIAIENDSDDHAEVEFVDRTWDLKGCSSYEDDLGTAAAKALLEVWEKAA